MDRVRVAVVAARAAVGHVVLEVGLSGQLAVAVRVDAASIDGAGWSNRTLTREHAGRAGVGACATRGCCAHGRRNGHVARAEHQAVVDHTVAVVVDAIARFGAWPDEPSTGLAASLGASTALARAAVDQGGIGAHGDALLGRQTFIGLSVAIVVPHVAGFTGGIDVAHASEVHPDALNRAELARHRVHRGGLTARASHASDVIDGAIAVVVDHVARFSRRQNGALAVHHAGDALRRAKLTCSDIGHGPTGHAGIGGRVIDHAVAIIVATVAEFGAGIEGADAAQDAVDALLRAFLTWKDVAHAAGHAGVTGVVVHLAVAIVIFPVASLGDLPGNFDVHPDALVGVPDALERPRVGNQSTDTAPLRITPADRADLAVARQIVGAVDETVAVVVDAVTTLLDVAVCRGALVFATRRVGSVEIDPARIALRDGAFRIGRVARLSGHGRRRALGRSVESNAVVAANAAIRRAGAQVDVFVDGLVAIVILVVALGVVVGVLDAVIRALAIAVEVVPTRRACSACARAGVAWNLVPIAANARWIDVREDRVAVVVTRSAVLRTVERDAFVDGAVAIVVELVADLGAAIRDHAIAGARAGTRAAPEDAAAFAANANAATGTAGSTCGRAGRTRIRSVSGAVVPAERVGVATGRAKHRQGSDRHQ